MMRRSLFVFLALCAALAASPVHAQGDYPGKVIRMIVGFAAGGGNDIFARLIAQRLTERTGWTVIIENKPGAGGRLAADYAAKEAPDGYTILVGASGAMAIGPIIYKTGYDTLKSFEPVTMIADFPLILVVHPDHPAKTVKELVEWTKANPDKANYSTSSPAFTLPTELFKLRTGADFTHVPYKGGGPAVTDLVAGHIGMMFASPIEVSQYVATGRLKYLVTSTKDRVASLPNVPTAGELGITGFDVVAWFGLVAPAGTPKDIVSRLSQEIGRILAAPDVKEKFAAQGAEITFLPADEFDRFLAREREQWAQAVKVSGAKIE